MPASAPIETQSRARPSEVGDASTVAETSGMRDAHEPKTAPSTVNTTVAAARCLRTAGGDGLRRRGERRRA